MKMILLTQGKVALVDDADFEWLSKWKWYAKKSSHSWYVVRNETVAEMKVAGRTVKKKIRMHNVIMKPTKGMEVHHHSEDGLDNQRHNLLVCAHGENVSYQDTSFKKKEKTDDLPF